MEPSYPHRGRGFTLIELVVVMAIMVVIMGIILSSQSSFNKTLILSNTAYDIALTLRSAETYGIGSLVGRAANTGYGLHFEKAKPALFTLFADTFPGPDAANCHGLPPGGASAPDARPGDCVYQENQDGKIRDYIVENGVTISDFCVLKSGSWSCARSGTPTILDIVFARPNPDAFMSDGTYSKLLPITKACLTIFSPHGGYRFISIAQSGQIIANAPSDPSSCHE